MATNYFSNTTSSLQGEAWAACNASYHEPNGDAYRTLGHALYVQAWHERIVARFAELDAQNSVIDRGLAGQGIEMTRELSVA